MKQKIIEQLKDNLLVYLSQMSYHREVMDSTRKSDSFIYSEQKYQENEQKALLMADMIKAVEKSDIL